KGILSFELGTDGAGGKGLFQNDAGYLEMNGREVYKFAVRQMPESTANVVEKAGLDNSDVDFLVQQQANIRIMDAARERIVISEDKMAKLIQWNGNNSSTSIPISLAESLEQGKIKDEDIVV